VRLREATNAGLDMTERLQWIKSPTMIIWGREDPLTPFRTVENSFTRISDVRVEVLGGVGHMPPIEAPDRFSGLLTAFLSRR